MRQHLSALMQLIAAVAITAVSISAAEAAAAAAVAAMSYSEPTFKECYCIFVRPKGRLAAQLRAEIRNLADRHGGPAFEPHVTVLAAIERPREEVVPLMRQLAAQVKKHRISFVEVTRGTFFYQCVFLLVAKDEGTMAAAAAARNVFGMTTPPYMPHLSLLYADLADKEKAKIVEYETARLYGESSDTRLPETGFDVESLELWYTPLEDKSTKSWRLVEKYPLI